jgi:hypothetical protein
MTQDYDIVIFGASFGGVSAALAAARYGKSAVLIEPSDGVGGQATTQGLTRWDETAPISSPNTYGSSKSYQLLKEDIRDWYRSNAMLAPSVEHTEFNPGFSSPGHPFSADCNITQTVLVQLLKDVAANVTVMLRTDVTTVNMTGERITSFVLSNGDTINGTIFVDATDLGRLLPKAGISWVIGAEGKNDTKEPHAEPTANPAHIQPITVSIAIEHCPAGENHVIAKPDAYTPELIAAQDFRVYNQRNGWIGGVLSSAHSDHPEWETIFNYRQYLDHANFSDANYSNDRSVVNVGCNDYQAAVIPTGDDAADAAIVEAARATSLAYLYWLQTEAPHDDGSPGTGYPNLKVRTDIFGRDDGTAPQAYIRESRRIARPIVPVLEQHIAVPDSQSSLARAPVNFADSCGICYYSADVHQCYGPPGTPYIGGINVRPFQIPLGSLIPTDASNVIAACKNIGTTHISSAAYRVHPGEWAIGEAAGTLAAYCVGQNVMPAGMHGNVPRVAAYQLRLLEYGTPIFWWDDVTFDDPKTFAAAHLLGVRGFLSDPNSLHFRPAEAITQSEQDAASNHAGKVLPWPSGSMTRAQAALWLCAELGLPSNEVVQQWNW